MQALLAETVHKVESDSAIKIPLGMQLEKIDGFVGNFTTTLGDKETVSHGAELIATGGSEYSPVEYDYAHSAKIITQRQLENVLADKGQENDKSYVLIQCLGSREEPNNYCSRICCQDALKNSIAIKEKAPDAEVVVIYRDMRAYGLKEDYYRRARDLGVLFFLYTPDEKPQVEVQFLRSGPFYRSYGEKVSRESHKLNIVWVGARNCNQILCFVRLLVRS